MKAICLILWMLLTLVLTFSLVGMLLFIPIGGDYLKEAKEVRLSTWMAIGIRLLDSVID
jgi:hypothetical protein